MQIIKAENVSKNYGDLTALKGLSLEVNEGSAFALLGPNGAGKTTFVRSLLGLTRCSGNIQLQGLDVFNKNARLGLAYLPEKFNFFSYYTVESVLAFYGKMQGLDGSQLEESIAKALDSLNITELRKKKMDKLSKGQVQRTGLANLLMGENKILILDEPFSGLDPIGIKDLKVLINNLKAEGKTIFINSHILSEMEQICDQVAILNKGNCLVQGSLSEVKGSKSLEDAFYDLVKGDAR
ncbi:MAG: ABC-2 type transport system ATP-binding protein [Bacteriovoracaceae bacterium]|jgi:ABC-2 type transport system ATP-binding protein